MMMLAGNRGFTLIETIIFIVVLAVGFGVVVPFIIGLKGSPTPVVAQQAMALAQAELDQTIAQRHASGFGPVATGPCVVSLTGFSAFSCSKTVCFVPATNLNDISNCATATNYKRVEVTITNAIVGGVKGVTLLTSY